MWTKEEGLGCFLKRKVKAQERKVLLDPGLSSLPCKGKLFPKCPVQFAPVAAATLTGPEKRCGLAAPFNC